MDEETASLPVAPAALPGGFKCLRCGLSGLYPMDSTTPAGAHRIEMDSCPRCDPFGEIDTLRADKARLDRLIETHRITHRPLGLDNNYLLLNREEIDTVLHAEP